MLILGVIIPLRQINGNEINRSIAQLPFLVIKSAYICDSCHFFFSFTTLTDLFGSLSSGHLISTGKFFFPFNFLSIYHIWPKICTNFTSSHWLLLIMVISAGNFKQCSLADSFKHLNIFGLLYLSLETMGNISLDYFSLSFVSYNGQNGRREENVFRKM